MLQVFGAAAHRLIFKIVLIQINTEERMFSINAFMTDHDLVRKCNEAMQLGVDFPTMWHTIIKPDPAVVGVPVQRLEGGRSYLEVPLLRGNWLVVDNEGRTTSLR
jgi:hypothetical protein